MLHSARLKILEELEFGSMDSGEQNRIVEVAVRPSFVVMASSLPTSVYYRGDENLPYASIPFCSLMHFYLLDHIQDQLKGQAQLQYLSKSTP